MKRTGKRKEIRLLALADLHCRDIRRNDPPDPNPHVFTPLEIITNLDSLLWHKSKVADHIIIAGDLTDGGREFQYEPVARVLNRYSYEQISVIPGNHDMTLNPARVSRNKYKLRFKQHMGKFLPEPDESEQRFPFVKNIGGDIAVVGLSTPRSLFRRISHTPLGVSASVGGLGTEQRAALREILFSPALDGKWLVVVMHHDPFDQQNPFTQMTDRKAVRTLLGEAAQHRKLIVVCGHQHRGAISRIDGNILHIQPPTFCGRRGPSKGGFVDITINTDLDFEVHGRPHG